MDTFHLRVFQGQVLDQCRFLLFAAEDVNAGINAHDTTRTLYAIQNLLNAGANISKMLWGQKGKRSEQRKHLRESIDIKDDSPLREVTMRNHFEHIDERIDRWWDLSEHHNYIDKILGPRNLFDIDAATIDMFRWFDPTTTAIVFWGEEFSLQSLVTEVMRIIPKLQQEASKPHWDAPVP